MGVREVKRKRGEQSAQFRHSRATNKRRGYSRDGSYPGGDTYYRLLLLSYRG